MKKIMLGEVWESFFIEGHKVGFLHRTTTAAQMPNILVSTLHIMYGAATFQHKYFFSDQVGYPSHSFLFDANDGAPVHVRFADNKMTCQIDEDVFTEIIPADARPYYGNYPLIMTMPFEEGLKVSFTQIDESSCTVQGTTELISHGWDRVKIGNQSIPLWLIGEYTNGQPANRYWLDSNRRIRQSHWKGALSSWVATQEEALSNLSTELINNANQLFDENHDSDWIDNVEEWFNQ